MNSKLSRFRVVGLLALPLIAIAIAVLLFAGSNSTASDVAEAQGPGMDLVCPDNVFEGDTITCQVLTNPAPGVAIAGYASEIVGADLTNLVITNPAATCASENQVTQNGGSPVIICTRGIGPSQELRHVIASQAAPPLTALDLTQGGSGEPLLDNLSFTCNVAGNYVLTEVAVPNSPFGGVYADLSAVPILIKADDAESINCTERPPDTPTPEQQKSATLVADPVKVLQGEVINLSGSANFRQDLDGDGVAGWSAGQATFNVGGLTVTTPAAASSGANAACAPIDATSAGCAATVDKDQASTPGSVPESVDPIDYSISVACDVVGTHTVSVTAAFLREDGSAVPPAKAINNVASVQVTCNPLTPPMLKTPALSNLFLTRQGEKIPPPVCALSTDALVLEEVVGFPITSLDPKGSQATQDLAAFEFEVRFDNKLVCVNLEPGPAAANMTCIIRDKDSSQLEGIAQIACFTQKGADFPDTTTEEGRHLADIVVRPQPELYSQIVANQDNGIAVQILDQGCELSDAQGHPIPIYSCEDADVTVRYLEGDVDADCDVNAASDGQVLAFRWGAELGNLLYNARYDLEPTASAGGGGVNGDGDIDVKDIQFVFGRHGSTCDQPNPPQPPVNPKE